MSDILLSKLPVIVEQARFGFGVFACRRFFTEAVVGKIRGQVIDDPDYSSDYCMDLGEGFSLEPAYPFRYLNHSCEPNCEIVEFEDDDDAPDDACELWLCATRRIEKGEELTIDYAWPADSAIPCGCGAVRCRGWVIDPDEIHLLDDQQSDVPRPDRSMESGDSDELIVLNG